MEFHIVTTYAKVDTSLVQEALWQIDPASVAHLDPDGRQLRVNIQTDAGELLAVLQSIDLPVDARDITQIPSICCGGCSG